MLPQEQFTKKHFIIFLCIFLEILILGISLTYLSDLQFAKDNFLIFHLLCLLLIIVVVFGTFSFLKNKLKLEKSREVFIITKATLWGRIAIFIFVITIMLFIFGILIQEVYNNIKLGYKFINLIFFGLPITLLFFIIHVFTRKIEKVTQEKMTKKEYQLKRHYENAMIFYNIYKNKGAISKILHFMLFSKRDESKEKAREEMENELIKMIDIDPDSQYVKDIREKLYPPQGKGAV